MLQIMFTRQPAQRRYYGVLAGLIMAASLSSLPVQARLLDEGFNSIENRRFHSEPATFTAARTSSPTYYLQGPPYSAAYQGIQFDQSTAKTTAASALTAGSVAQLFDSWNRLQSRSLYGYSSVNRQAATSATTTTTKAAGSGDFAAFTEEPAIGPATVTAPPATTKLDALPSSAPMTSFSTNSAPMTSSSSIRAAAPNPLRLSGQEVMNNAKVSLPPFMAAAMDPLRIVMPEPGSTWLFTLGLVALLLWRRRDTGAALAALRTRSTG